MQLPTIDSCNEWLRERGISLSTRKYPLVSESVALEFPIPSHAGQMTALAYFFGDLESESFNGGLLIFREWSIGSPGLDAIGHQIVERMLAVASENVVDPNRVLPIALSASEAALVPALLLQAMIFGWDAFYVPNSAPFVLFVSHDEVAYLIGRNVSYSQDATIQIERLSSGTVPTPHMLSQSADEP